MSYDPQKHHRRSIRLKGYDYALAGAYFITLCTHNRACVFGEIVVRAGWEPALNAGVDSIGAGIGVDSARAGWEPAPTMMESTHPLNADGGMTATMRLNEYGQIVEYTWYDLVNHVVGIELGEFVVMPNHVHGIIVIVGDAVGAGSKPARVGSADNVRGAGLEPAPTKFAPLPEIVRQLKTFSARRINQKRGTPGTPVWQRNYWEHIIRNEKSYQDIATYIVNNPTKWEIDKLYSKM